MVAMSMNMDDAGKTDSLVWRGIAKVRRVLQSEMFVNQEEKRDAFIPLEGTLSPARRTSILI